jgi:hypothetical protein
MNRQVGSVPKEQNPKEPGTLTPLVKCDEELLSTTALDQINHDAQFNCVGILVKLIKIM